jgi:hypothetical protein
VSFAPTHDLGSVTLYRRIPEPTAEDDARYQEMLAENARWRRAMWEAEKAQSHIPGVIERWRIGGHFFDVEIYADTPEELDALKIAYELAYPRRVWGTRMWINQVREIDGEWRQCGERWQQENWL